MTLIQFKKFIFVLSVFSVLTASSLAAQNASDDRYAPVYHQPLKAAYLKDPVSRLIALPFEIVRWPVDKTLTWLENEAVLDKAKWLYNYINNHGIHPDFDLSRQGVSIELPKLTKLQTKYPDFLWDVWLYYGHDVYFQTGTRLGLEKIGGTNAFINGIFQYEDRYEESFYGIGPDTSRGEGASYGIETTKMGLEAGYEFSSTLQALTFLTYRQNNIDEEGDEDRGRINFNLPGRTGDDILTLGARLKRDTRDFEDTPTQGGYQKFEFSYNEGVDGSEARYFHYRGEAAQYVRVGSPRRILAGRAVIEHRDEINGGYVPFYDLSRLGGYGNFPGFGDTLRGFAPQRFAGESEILFNFEYRYTIWENRDWQGDAVPFVDIGQTFGEFSEFQFKDFAVSYGLEFRLSLAKRNIANLALAHSDEGTWFYLCSRKSF